ncbi:MAG: hypothetical protein WBH50_11205 [Fuerstiella sp.]
MPDIRGPRVAFRLVLLLLTVACAEQSFGQEPGDEPGTGGEPGPGGGPGGEPDPELPDVMQLPFLAVPSCPSAYLGEANGICIYETSTIPGCAAPTGFGQNPLPAATNLGCNGNGDCIGDLNSSGSVPGEENQTVEPPPATFAEAIQNLEAIKAKLDTLNSEDEIESGRKSQIAQLLQFSTEYLTYMNDATAGTEAQRLAVFLNGDATTGRLSFASVASSYKNRWNIVRLTTPNTTGSINFLNPGSTSTPVSWLADRPTQTNILDAAALTVNVTTNGTVQAGQIVKILQGEDPPIYFKTFYVGRVNTGPRMQIGQEVNAPANETGVVTGTFADKHAYSHRIMVGSTPFLVTTKTDLGFKVE